MRPDTPTRAKGTVADNINLLIGVRDCPYGICCTWVRGGWDLDALGKFFRRRRRRRRPRLRVPLLFRWILIKSRHFCPAP